MPSGIFARYPWKLTPDPLKGSKAYRLKCSIALDYEQTAGVCIRLYVKQDLSRIHCWVRPATDVSLFCLAGTSTVPHSCRQSSTERFVPFTLMCIGEFAELSHLGSNVKSQLTSGKPKRGITPPPVINVMSQLHSSREVLQVAVV